MDNQPFMPDIVSGADDGTTQSQEIAPLPNVPNPNDLEQTVLSGVEAIVPGAGLIASLLSAVGDVPAILQKVLHEAEGTRVIEQLPQLLAPASKFAKVLEIVNGDLWAVAGDISIGPLLGSMLEAGLGIKLSEFDKDTLEDFQTVDTMVGFAAMLPVIIGAAETPLKNILGARFGEFAFDAIKEIPEEMGLTWALGMVIDRLFEAAFGETLIEEVQRQKRNQRVAWQQARVLLRQGVLSDTEMTDIFERQGFPDYQIEWLKKLADQTIPVGDISQLWYRDQIDDETAKKLIYALGFSDEQVGWLFDLYISKADNTASASYRSILREMFTAHLISEDEYRSRMLANNFPKKMIDADIQAIELEQSIGRQLHSVSAIKTRYLHHAIESGEAIKELRELNYSDEYITELMQSWNLGPVKAQHGLTQAKILSYMISGVLTPDQARPLLQSTGLYNDTVEFLIAHPTANNGVHLHARSPGLVTQAYVDGAIGIGELADAYRSAGVREQDVPWYVNVAKYRLSHHKGSSTYTQTLSAADYRAAFKAGIIDFQQCVSYLDSLGYRPEDALLLTEITNKGPYQAPGSPAFRTLDEAISFMENLGATIYPPSDPRVSAAETMLMTAGYSIQLPYSPGTPINPPIVPHGPPGEGP